MSTLTLFDAVTRIRKGQASKILDQLHDMHLHSPQDIRISYVLAHALDVCGQKNRAKSVWETVRSLPPEQEVPEKKNIPDGVPVFTYTDSLHADLNRILKEENKEDEIRNLIEQLDAKERTDFDEALLTGDTSLDDLPEESYEDPVTETFARILVTQKKYSEAATVYRSLGEQKPEERDRLLGEADRLELLASQQADS